MTADITILLSAYNGAPYLPTQIGSICQQKRVGWTLQIRDDGSNCEASRELLTRYADDPRVTVEHGDNIGAVASFFELLRTADPNARYYAFADQDDYWLDDKLARAVGALDAIDPDVPAAYGARAQIGDAELRPVGLTPDWPRAPAFGNAVVENILGGCTLVLNRAARRRVLETPFARLGDVQMHDVWCYMVCAAFGRVVFDSKPCLIYRQHDRNCIGAGAKPWHRFVAKIGHQVRGGSGDSLRRQARLFWETYADALSLEQRSVLWRFIRRDSRMANLRTAADRRLWRQFPLDDVAMRMLIATGRI